jgi:hypothetical protein
MSEVKFCKDCKWYRKGINEVCLRPVINLIDGTTTSLERYCASERYFPDGEPCGKEAKYFEPKEI